MLVFKKAVFLGVPGGARDYGRVREGLTTNRGVAKPRNIIVVKFCDGPRDQLECLGPCPRLTNQGTCI